MSMSRDVVLRLIGDADSAKKALGDAAAAAGVTVREYKRAEQLQNQQARAAQRLAAEQSAAASVIGSSMMGMGVAIVGGLGLAVKAAIDWESAWAGVKKVLKDPGSFDMVEKQLRDLAGILPVTHAEIAEVAAAAAQLGVQDGNVAAFTKTMIMLGTTTNLSATEAATGLARFSNIMGTSQAEASNLGSTIVYLGNNFATTESEILSMAMRLAAAGRQAGMTEADVLGMSAALSSVGIEAESGGTAFTKVITDITQAVGKGGDKLDEFAKLAGMSADEFSQKWKTAPAQALASVVEGFGKLQKSGGDVYGTLDRLGIQEERMRQALLSSAAAGDLLSQALSGANNAFSENSALQQEAETRYDTTAAKLQIFKNSISEAGITVGSALLPALTALVDAVSFVVEGFSSLPGPVQAGIGIILGIVGASALGGGALLNLKGKVDEVKTAFSTMKTADGFMGKMSGFMGMLGPAAGLIGITTAAVSLLSSIFGSGSHYVSDYSGAVDEMAGALKESNGALDDNVRAIAAKQAADEGILDVAKKAGVDLNLVTEAILGNKDAYDQVIDSIQKYSDSKDGIGYDEEVADATMAKEKLAELSDASKEAADKAKLQAEATGQASDAMSGQEAAAAAAGMTTEEYAQAQADAADASDQTKEAVDALKDAFDRLNGANIDALEATSSMTLALSAMGKAVEQNGTNLDVTTEAGAKNIQMYTDLVKKAEDVVTAKYQETGSVAAARAAYDEQRQSIIDNAVALGFNKEQIIQLLDQMFLMPTDLETGVSTPGANEALAALEGLNAEAYKAANGTVQVKTEALTDESKAKLAELGLVAQTMPNGEVLITATTADAQAALDVVKGKEAEVDAADPNVNVSTSGTGQATGEINNVTGAANNVPPSKNTKVNADTGAAQSKIGGIISGIAAIKDKSVTITTIHKTFGSIIAGKLNNADGGYVQTFANGGTTMRESHIAQFAPSGTWRVWAEDETGGEWYLPESPTKRGRSKQIAAQMLDGWGYKMVPKGVNEYAYGTQPTRVISYGSPSQQESGGLQVTNYITHATVKSVGEITAEAAEVARLELSAR